MRPRATSRTIDVVTQDRLDQSKQSESFAAEELIRLLEGLAPKAEYVERTAALEPCEEILVDAELGGYRYLVVRLPRPTANRVSLSPREQEIVRMVAQGHPNKVIAGVLNISGWTVCTHLRRIFAKLGVGSRAAMVARTHEMGVADHRSRPTCDASNTAAPQRATAAVPEEQKMVARFERR